MAGLPNIATIQYGGLYIPVFTMAYIRESVGLPVILPIPYIEPVIDTGNFGLWFAVVLFGALVNHGVTRSIFGLGGALQNPKSPSIVRWYRTVLFWKSRPGLYPNSISNAKEKVQSSVESFFALPCWRMAITALWRCVRGISFSVSSLLYSVMVLGTTILLLIKGTQGELDYLGLLLATSQTAFFYGSIIHGRFPSVVEPEAARWINVPEYLKADILKERGDIEIEHEMKYPGSISGYLQELSVDEKALAEDDSEQDHLITLEERGSESDFLIPLDDGAD